MFRKFFGSIFHFFDWVSDILTRPGKWIERIFMNSLESADVLSNDRWFSRLIVWVFEPFRWLFAGLDRATNVRLRSTRDSRDLDDEDELLKKLERSEKIAKIRRNLKRSWISRLGQVIVFPFVAVLTLLYLILRSRTGGRILIPLFVVSMAIGGLTFFLFAASGRERMAGKYEEAVVRALANKDFSTAELYRRKLEQLGVRSDASQYRTALALDEQGKFNEAYAAMLSIAPESELGFPPAHLWLAASLLQGKLPMSSTSAIAKAMSHLKMAETYPQLVDRVHYLRGMAFISVNNVDRAETELTLAAQTFPEAAYTLLELQMLNRSDRVKETARIVQRHLGTSQSVGGNNQAEMMAEIHVQMALGDYESQTRAIEKFKSSSSSLSQSDDSQLYRLNLYLVGRWLDVGELERLDSAMKNFDQASASLKQGAELSELHSLLAKVWMTRESQKGKLLLERMMDDENPSSEVIEFFGSVIAGSEDWETSRDLMYRAVKLNPDNARALNNLAHILSRYYPEKMDEALEYANHAVELSPQDARLRETRGYIEVQKELWQKAIEDYGLALNGLGDRPELLNGLAQAHSAMGDDYQAQKYRSAAARASRSQ